MPNVNDAENSETPESIVVEALWAPKDPRDKLYDEDASDKEKAESMVRIIAAFHPVMNAPVLIFDLMKMVGLNWSLVILGAFLTAGLYLFFG